MTLGVFTINPVTSWLANNSSFQQFLLSHPNVDLQSLQNDPALISLKEQYDQSVQMGKSRLDPDPSQKKIDINTFMQGVLEASKMQRQAASASVEGILAECHEHLDECFLKITMVVDQVKKSLNTGGGERIDTNIGMGGEVDTGTGSEFELSRELVKDVLPHLKIALDNMDSIRSYLTSFKDPQNKEKALVTTFSQKRKANKDVVIIAEDLHQFACKNTKFVTSYEGLKAVCSFRDVSQKLVNSLKKLS